jgi:glycosyltransferase involved in cell wall biosynthesis
MRVLHVISSLSRADGGPVGALLGLAVAQRRSGLLVSVVSTYREGADEDVAQQMRDHDIAVTLLGPTRTRLMYHRDIRGAILSHASAADVVHIHGLWEEVVHRAAELARARHVPYILRPCGMLDPWSLSQNRWMKRLYLAFRLRRHLNSAAAIHFTADAEREGASSLRLRPPATVRSCCS